MKKWSHVFRGAAAIFLALTILVSIVSQVAGTWAGKVNELLGIVDTTVERSDDPADYRFLSDFENASDLIQAEIALNTRLAAEGSVVLKGTPAISGTKVTLFGMRSGEKMQFGGSMGELTDASNTVTLADAMTANGFSVNPDFVQFYKDMAGNYAPGRASGGNIVSSYEDQGAEINEVPIGEYSADMIGDYTDAAVVVFGRDAGESACFYPGLNGLKNPSEFSGSSTKNILGLSDDERALLNWVKNQGFSKIVVLLNSASAMEIEELKADDAIHSIMWIGNPGAYGTYGIAQLLSGEVLPSGHLPDTFAVNSAKSPAAQNYGIYTFANPDDIETTTNHALRGEWYVVEAETIYTGYKYYETRYFDSVLGQGNASMAAHNETANGSSTWSYDNEVSYSFGYGVEGSTFSEEITGANIDWSGENDSTVTVKVTNTGSAAAKHVVQLYVSVPYTDHDKRSGVEKSAIQLVGYAKTGEAQERTYADVVLLDRGESEEVTITFNARDFYSYDMTYSHDGVTGAYYLAAGDYYFATGNGAHDAVQAVLSEMRPDLGIEATGTVRVEHLSGDAYLTESNGVIIQNQMGNADLNRWNSGTTVTYLTRNDWANTFPSSIDSITATPEMITYLRNTLYDATEALANYDGPTEFTYGADNGIKAVDLIGLDYDDPKFEEALNQMTLQDLVNQYLAILEELPGLAFPKEQPADSPMGLIATIGQRSKGSIYEVSSDDPAYGYHTNAYVGAPVVAATFSPFLQSEEGRMIANDALWTGYTTWFGPGLNLHRTPYNGRNVAYYSEDSVLTGLTATYVHRSLWAKGVVTNAKHFAFNDQETNRDGIAVFLSEQAAREGEMRGFQIPIRDGSMWGMMTGFNRLGLTHVAAHTGIMNGIVRGEWGFKGYVMTDSVKSAQYFLPRETLLAGNNLMLGGSNNGSVWEFTVETVGQDPVIQSALRESFHQKLYVYANSVLLNGMTQDSEASGGVVWWITAFRVAFWIALIGFVAFFALFLINEWKENKKNWNALEITSGIVALILIIAGTVLFAMSYTTGYYVFGEMQSTKIAILLGAAIVAEIVALTLRAMMPREFWPKLVAFVVIGCLAAAAALIVGDRVEGIGNCIVTDYDSGHGGEEAIYMSLAGAILMLIAVVYNVIGCFSRGKDADAEKEKSSVKMAVARNVGFGVSAVAVLLAVLIPTYRLVNPASPGGPGGTGTGGTYTVSYNANSGNADGMPSYQFLCSNLKGMVQADSRFYIDVTLTLDGEGGYTIFSDAYVIESGNRAVIGDDTGLGMVLTTEAEGTYVDNGDGTVTTSVPTHAVFTMETDTYSSQMKGAAQMNVNGNDEDGTYDSNDEPAVLDFVPETVWTLGEGTIITYRDANSGGSFTTSFNLNNGNLDNLPNYQFFPGDLSGMMANEARLFVDVTLTLDGSGNYTLLSDAYTFESGVRTEIGDDTGLGMILTMNASGTYTENGDGTYTTAVPAQATFEMQWDTYSAQLRDALGMNVNGQGEGTFDSASEPSILDFVPETIWTVSGSEIVTWANVNGGEEGPGGDKPSGDGLVVTSDDGATTFTFYADGTYVFAFADYGVEDPGTYTYDGATLVITDKNGAETLAEGDPIQFHYVFSDSDQLTGDFTVSAADLATLLSGGASGSGLVVVSDDEATTMTFNADGTYVFAFEAYGIEDPGTYTYDGTTLTVTNSAGAVMTAEGDPLKLHYVSGVSDQLTGDFTVAAADLAAVVSGSGTSGSGLVVISDDEATTMTFNADGTYVFAFEAYGIEDPGTYTYDGTTLTVTNSAGAVMTAEGDPLKLHYVSGVSDQLTGDFTVSANDLAAVAGDTASLVINSADGGTVITFKADGTYVFAFPAYGVEDAGTYTYENGTLTVTNSAGTAVTAEGDSMTFTYVSAVSDQLTGEFTVPATAVAVLLDGGSGVTVVSDDSGTTFTFNADGTYVFAFAAYGIEDPGTYAYDGTTLTVTNSAGAAVTADGDTLKFHYVSGVSDQLTGDFSVPATAIQ